MDSNKVDLRSILLREHKSKIPRVVQILLKDKKPSTAKVFPSDKTFAVFPKDLVSPKVIIGMVDSKTMLIMLKAFLSKNPHLNYLYFTVSKYSEGRQYWFLDTMNNRKIILTDTEIKYNNTHLLKRQGNGYLLNKPITDEEIRNEYSKVRNI